MLHLFMEKGPWFRAKSHGYGAGLPFRWQGWALLAAHISVMIGIALALPDRPLLMAILITGAGLAPLPIYAARTEGGWRWRWGKPDSKDRQKRR